MKTIKDIRIYALVSMELHDNATHFVLSNLQDANIQYSISDLKIK